jgi:hypothetical protein
MDPTNADFGRRLFSRRISAARGLFPVGVGVLLLAGAVFLALHSPSASFWAKRLAPVGAYVPWAVAGLGILNLAAGLWRRRHACHEQHFYEDGACDQRAGRAHYLAYADAGAVTFVVRANGDRVERSISFVAPGGQPLFRLYTDLADGEASEDDRPTANQVQNVASRVTKAVAARMVRRVDGGEVVQWTERLWLDPAGVRVGDAHQVRVVPWGTIEGVKDGSQSGRIEIYAFGSAEPVAVAQTLDVNALPGFQAFMHLLERAQSTAQAA